MQQLSAQDVTNVPGSRVLLYFCGARMVGMYGTGPVFDGMGMICPVYSYGDTIAVSFTCDRDMMPDPDAYAQALRDAFAALKAAASKPTPIPPVEANENHSAPKRKTANRNKGA